MSRNLMVCGLEFGIMPRVLRQLHRDGVVNIAKWLYDENMSDKVVSTLTYARARTTLWREKWQVCDKIYPESVGQYITKNMDWLMQEFARDTEFYREPFYELKNVIYHMAREIYAELKEGDIDCVLFPDVPHGNINALVYVVAKSLNIKTIYIVPSYDILGKFTYAQEIEQYGDYKMLPLYDPHADKIHIDNQYEKTLSYMDEEQIKRDRGEDWERKLELIFSPLIWVKKKKEIIRKISKKYDGVSDYGERKLVRLISEQSRKRRYKRDVNMISVKNVDFNNKYVYFPLHLQPEMTVDTIGEIYRDQLLAVEQVRRLIPLDWYIYVKENPKQLPNNTRGKYFFKRLKSIDKVIFVDRHVDTYKLLRYSQFVATITGTVGWEAISGGKPVLTFGECWYRHLPGVVRYHQGTELKEIVNCSWTHDELENEYAKLVATMCDGAWLNEVIVNMDGFDSDENKLKLYKSMKFILLHCLAMK